MNAIVMRSKNLAMKYPADPTDPLNHSSWGVQLNRVRAGAVVELIHPLPANPKDLPKQNDPLVEFRPNQQFYVVKIDGDGKQTFVDHTGAEGPLPDDLPNMNVYLVELLTQVQVSPDRLDGYSELALHPSQHRYIGKVLDRDNPRGRGCSGLARLVAGSYHRSIRPGTSCRGPERRNRKAVDGWRRRLRPADPRQPCRTGRRPGRRVTSGERSCRAGRSGRHRHRRAAVGRRLLRHGRHRAGRGSADYARGTLRYRIAVVDRPGNSSITEIRDFRGRFDSKYAALYHPWIEILDPLVPTAPGIPPQRLLLPPSGFVAGIYARNDIERGVYKAPANEVVRGLTRFELNINNGRQDVLNPEGINCLRFFEGRGNRVWGARTMSSRSRSGNTSTCAAFHLHRALDRQGTQWAVFEPNNERLWRNIRQTVEDFLFVLWRDGALLGDKPEEAYFVRCDRTTMTQNDLDNGRMICLDRRRAVAPGRIRDLPHRPVDRGRARSDEGAVHHGNATRQPLRRLQLPGHARRRERARRDLLGGFSDVSGLGRRHQITPSTATATRRRTRCARCRTPSSRKT